MRSTRAACAGAQTKVYCRAVQIAVCRFAGRTEIASHQQFKHRVAAVRKAERADLVDRAPVHVQVKIVFQANASIVRNFLYYTTYAGWFSSGHKKMIDLSVTFCYNLKRIHHTKEGTCMQKKFRRLAAAHFMSDTAGRTGAGRRGDH